MIDTEARLAEGQRQWGAIRNEVDERQALTQWFEAHLKEFEKIGSAQLALKAAAHGFSESIIKKVLPGLMADHAMKNDDGNRKTFSITFKGDGMNIGWTRTAASMAEAEKIAMALAKEKYGTISDVRVSVI